MGHIERMIEHDRQSFYRMVNGNWKDRYLLNGTQLTTEDAKKLIMDSVASGQHAIDGVSVRSAPPIEEEFPGEVAFPYDTWVSTRGAEKLVDYALAINPEVDFLARAIWSVGAKFTWSKLDLVAVYMHTIDITGPERMCYSQMLIEAGFLVPRPIFATTNFYVAEYIEDGEPVTVDEIVDLHRQFDKAREQLIVNGEWKDPNITIGNNPSNYRKREGMVYNIDPFYRTPRDEF